ncbi:MAG TPA: serine hydrolase domain-containing protein, partial [Spirochaetota bacterium]|nr:serine hydrolase domain-containing protein [Spirochaetota bacterium]
MKKKVLKVAAVILVVLVACAAIFHKNIRRLHGAVTLFDADVIDENFRSADRSFPTTIVRRGDTVHEFARRPGALPETYTHKGKVKNLAAFLEKTGTTGLVVIKDGAIVFEKYYRGNTEKSRVISWSVAKSFISALLGLAVNEGFIRSISQPVTDYVPQLRGTGYDGVSIKDVMNMSSGIRFNEEYGDFFSDIQRMGRTIAFGTSLDAFVASLKRERAPGTYRHYVSADT